MFYLYIVALCHAEKWDTRFELVNLNETVSCCGPMVV